MQTHLSVLKAKTRFYRDVAWPKTLSDMEYNSTDESEHADYAKEMIVEQIPRATNETLVHYGTIATSYSVPQDIYTRDTLSSKLGGVICFDTEAAGMSHDFPSLVIRGICDYADHHRNEKWRLHAAVTASAYTKELIMAMSEIRVSSRNAIVSDFLEKKGQPLCISKFLHNSPPFESFSSTQIIHLLGSEESHARGVSLTFL